MKITILGLTLMFVLFFSVLAGTGFVSLGKASLIPPPVSRGSIRPETVGAEPPVIMILAPQNNSVSNKCGITLPLNVSVGNSSTTTSRWLSTVHYKADWQKDNIYVYSKGLQSPISEFSTTLNLTGINGTRIPEGKHNVTVYVTEEGSYKEFGVVVGSIRYLYIDYQFFVYGSSMVEFTVDYTSPIVSVLLMENKTYETSDVPLNFTVNEPVSQTKYSLDGQNNVTITGNTTLTGLPSGNHNITLYATDDAGNVGASETAYFKVAEPYPVALVVIASVVSSATITVGLLVFFKKRKH